MRRFPLGRAFSCSWCAFWTRQMPPYLCYHVGHPKRPQQHCDWRQSLLAEYALACQPSTQDQRCSTRQLPQIQDGRCLRVEALQVQDRGLGLAATASQVGQGQVQGRPGPDLNPLLQELGADHCSQLPRLRNQKDLSHVPIVSRSGSNFKPVSWGMASPSWAKSHFRHDHRRHRHRFCRDISTPGQ
jgi:hypothetical protein